MPFGYAYINEAFGVFLFKSGKAGTAAHCCGNGAHAPVPRSKFAHIFAEAVGKALSSALYISGDRVERPHAVVLVRVLLRIEAALALCRDDMHNDRLFHILCQTDHRLQSIHVMSIDRAKIFKAHLGESI